MYLSSSGYPRQLCTIYYFLFPLLMAGFVGQLPKTSSI
jgi:hypothetical protein